MRERWIDVLKGIGIFLVCFGHLNPDVFTETHIYSFHMPLFFFISGYLFLNKKYEFNDFIKRKFKSLLIPYFLFASISLVIGIFLRIIAINDFKSIISNFLFLEGTVGWNSPIWFLIVLFLCEILYYLISYKLDKKLINISVLIICILGYLLQSNDIIIPFGLYIVPVGITFYHLGVLFRQYDIKAFIYKNKILTLILSLIVNLTFSYFLNVRISVYHAKYGNYLYFYIGAIAGILLYCSISIIIGECSLVELLGRNTLLILGTQYIIFRGFMIVQGVLGIQIMYLSSLPIALILTIITLGLYLMVIKIHNNYILRYTNKVNILIFQ